MKAPPLNEKKVFTVGENAFLKHVSVNMGEQHVDSFAGANSNRGVWFSFKNRIRDE